MSKLKMETLGNTGVAGGRWDGSSGAREFPPSPPQSPWWPIRERAESPAHPHTLSRCSPWGGAPLNTWPSAGACWLPKFLATFQLDDLYLLGINATHPFRATNENNLCE